MTTITSTKKRKSADGNASVSKKAKITKSADKPAPLKSALKKSKSSTIVQRPVQNGSTKKRATKKDIEEPIEDADETPELSADQTAALLAGFSSDSSDNEASDTEEGLAISSLPKAPTTKKLQQQIASATADAEADPETTPSVLYIGRIPHGFHEPQMRSYFSQFGTITNLRLARNKKTGRSQHYAFIEFASAAVADIVRRTMDKYLLFGHLLQVRHVARENVSENMFKGAGRKGRRRAPRNRMEGRRLEKGMGREEWGRRVEREVRKRSEKAKVLEEMGYEFSMPVVRGVEDVPVKGKEVEGEVGGGVEDGEEVRLLMNGEDADNGEANGVTIVEEKVTKERPAHGKTETKKKVKKTKT